MKAVLISIRPEWCERIISGEKTVEIRKNRPKLEPPFKCYVYCTYGRGLIERFDAIYPNVLLVQTVSSRACWGNCCNGKVIGEFICDKIVPVIVFENGSIQNWKYYELEKACVDYRIMADYIGSGKTGYGWHISDFKVYTAPKELDEFKVRRRSGDWSYAKSVKRAPQTWCYVEELT